MDEAVRLEGAGMAGEEIVATMRNVDRREWWLWSSAISVTLVLALGIASFALPSLLPGVDSFFAFFLGHAVRGLLGLVVLFSVYVVYEQVQIRRIRREFADQLYKLAVLDPLTGLFNRRYIDGWLKGEIARCQRHNTPLTLILFDLDAFKQVNDEHGHAVGDDALKVFAERLKKATRGSDVVARCGGDEFLALLPDCKPDAVQYILKRLNGIRIAASESTLPVQYSAGWTDYNIGESVTQFWKRADAALYLNKRRPKGRPATSTGSGSDWVAPETLPPR